METKNKILIAVLVAGILVAGWWMTQKGICGPKARGSNYDGSYCDRSCNSDSDCKFTCGCGAINKNDVCHAEGIIYDCINHEMRCESGKCVIGQESIPTVTIGTDKTVYMQGETIHIAVKNSLNLPILYYGGERFWGIEYFENDTWKNHDSENGGGFQLAEGNINDSCYIRLYERMLPDKMDANSTVSLTWNQKICPYGGGDPYKANFVSYIEPRRYRLVFNYGFEALSNDSFKIADIWTVYSNEFQIKYSEDILAITTDKTEYTFDEYVNFTIKNNINITQFITFPSIERFENNRWAQIRFLWVGCGVTGGLRYLPIGPYETPTYIWNQNETWCDPDPSPNMFSQEAAPGKYRIKGRVVARTKNEAEDPNNIFGTPTETLLYSNEFTIK